MASGFSIEFKSYCPIGKLSIFTSSNSSQSLDYDIEGFSDKSLLGLVSISSANILIFAAIESTYWWIDHYDYAGY